MYVPYQIKTINEDELKKFMNDSTIANTLTAKVLMNRGYEADFIKKMIHEPESFYRDPKAVFGTEAAAKKIIKHISRPRNKIYIFSDYDVDGITSMCLLKIFLEDFKMKTEIELRIPERKEGYGLNADYCRQIINDAYYSNEDKLVITVDNGVSCVDQIAMLNEYGIDTVVIDHHMPQKGFIPAANVICNPHMKSLTEDTYEGQHLADVAVVYKVCQCINSFANEKSRVDLNHFLPFVAMGTISDMMELTPENMAIIIRGLEELKEPSEGNRFKKLFQEICKHINRKKIFYTHIAWNIAPMLNACGRISTPKIAAKLFLSYFDSADKIQDVLRETDEVNNLRKRKSTEAMIEVEKKYDFSNELICCCELRNTPEGILGQVANKILEKENKPVFVLKKNEEGMLTGSGRSPLDIIKILEEEKGKTVHFFAGHKGAFGIQIYPDKLKEFKKNVSDKIKGLDIIKEEEKITYIDSYIDLEDISLKNYHDINMIPQKDANKPIFAIKNLKILECTPSKNNPNNIKFYFSNGRKSMEIWGWGAKSKLDKLQSLDNITIICSLDVNFQNPNMGTATIIDIFNE